MRKQIAEHRGHAPVVLSTYAVRNAESEFVLRGAEKLREVANSREASEARRHDMLNRRICGDAIWFSDSKSGIFGIEFAVALAIGSVSLLADSINSLEDTSLK